jgi:NitT/TauT family transport system permease protein
LTAVGSKPLAARRPRLRRWAGAVLPATVLLALLAGVWQVVAVHNRFWLPTLGGVASQLTDHPMYYLNAAAVTLKESGIGLGASFVVAFGLAVAMSHVRVVERAVMPVAVIVNVTPVVALAPGLALAFGLTSTMPRYVVTGIIVFFPMLVNSLVGLRSVDPEALRYFDTLAANRREVLVHLRVPASLPYLFAAARICFPLSIVGAVVAEFSTSGSDGLGSLIEVGTSDVVPAVIYAALFCLSVMGLAVTVVVMVAEHRLLAWDPGRALPR